MKMTVRFRFRAATVGALAVASIAVGLARQTPPPPPGGQRPGGPPAGGRQGGAPFPRVPALPFPKEARTFDTLAGPIRVVPFVSGLVSPWSLAFLPNGDMLVAERTGQLRLIQKGVLAPQPIAGVPPVVSAGQGGLLDVVLHPKFADNTFVYFTYSKKGERGNTTALARGKFDGQALTDVQDLFVADAWSTGSAHFGSRIVFARDGTIFMTVGERNDRTRAQDTSHHAGKVLRLRDDGTVPPDNPFVGRAGVRPEIYSYGHRNMQGLALHPDTGAVWETEHGPQGGDELNVISPGKNYGWPVVTFGREYSGEVITDRPWREDMEPPVTIWVPSPGLSGLTFYTGDKFPGWKGNLFAGGLAGLSVQRVVFTPRGLVGRETLIGELRQRVRDVREGPDGFLYVLTDANAGGILRIEPAPPTSGGR
ncbi:MAG TPA: PQQ-dependent sugar dehydrogenase [Vicinamibacterales bacterium]|nr:PQQ-dependent sugar dehydrogenase [Vicinamibacterales bacterium]